MTSSLAAAIPVRSSAIGEPWRCPMCLGLLDDDGRGPRCGHCGQQYLRTSDGRADLRVDGRRMLTFDCAYEPDDSRFSWDLVQVEWPQTPLPFDVPPEWETTELSLVRSIPAAAPGQRSIDLGCGGQRQRFRAPLARLGYDHFGIDIDGTAPDALADAHLLPFADRTFDLVVTSAVFEHLKHPHIAMAEAARVARPGALFVGSVAFSEPYHISYFHHSPLAVFALLDSAGFECRSLVVSNKWSAFHAHLEMGFAGARYPAWLRRLVPSLFLRATQVQSAVKWALGRGRGPLQQDLKSFARSHSAAVGFVAVRVPREKESRLRRSA